MLKDLAFDPADYPHGLTTFDALCMSMFGVKFTLRTRQHAIRRYEFDNWLLNRSGAPVETHMVKTITREKDGYTIDGEFFGQYLVGAGGTYCPVYRAFFKAGSPKSRGALIAAQEEEFPYAHTSEDCQMWFFENHLPGHAYQPSAHTYYLRQRLPEIRKENAFIVGDAAGLATLDMGEGISPAIKSGLLAAESILHGSAYTVDSIPRYSLFPGVLLESLFSPLIKSDAR